MKFDKTMLTLYAVTDRSWTGKHTLFEQVEQALKGGVTIVQLREKELDEESFLKEAFEMKKLCEKYSVPLIINDDVEIALKCGADGVHVGSLDMPVAEIRRLAGDDFIIGATAKTPDQARAAEKSGADYLGVGAVFPSPTKKDALGITNEMLSGIVNSVNIPCAAIGGITLENADVLKGSGVCGIAVISALFSAENIEKRARQLREKAEEVCKE